MAAGPDLMGKGGQARAPCLLPTEGLPPNPASYFISRSIDARDTVVYETTSLYSLFFSYALMQVNQNAATRCRPI